MRIEKITLEEIGVFDKQMIAFGKKENEGAEIHIFTGANGSGKSTVLYALAAAFDVEVGRGNGLYKRCRFQDDKSLVTVNFGGNANVVVLPAKFKWSSNYSIKYLDEFHYTCFANELPNHIFGFAAFAYSGYRYLKSEKTNTVKEFEGNPLKQALTFVKETSDSDFTVNQWLLNTISNRALSKQMGDEESEKRYTESFSSFKGLLNNITGLNIDFVVELNPTRLFTKIDGAKVDFDVLPDGLKSLISWIGDLMMIMDQLKWKENISIFKRNFFLFLDEIEVHLHPKWQRKVLPVIKDLFPNAQIFLSTHSPFVVNSVDGAWIHELNYKDGRTVVKPAYQSKTSNSIDYVLEKVFGITEDYGERTQKMLDRFYAIRTEIMANNDSNTNEFLELKDQLLALDDLGINNRVTFELRQLSKVTNDQIYVQ